MTCFAFPRRGLIEDNAHSSDLSLHLVAVITSHVAVGALQRKRRAFVVVESGRFPARRIMTAGTIGAFLARRELTRVWVLVASEALLGGRQEIHIFQTGLDRRRPMTVAAGYTAVRSDQRKRRLRVIESV